MKTIKQILKALLTAVSCTGIQMAYASDNGHTKTTNIQKYLEKVDAVGASVAMIDKGQIEYFFHGKRSLHSSEPISNKTIFEIGSITKVFTTLVLMDLVENGDVQLDDPIEMYLPKMKLPKFEGKKITLRHLATHMSGLPCLPDNFNPKNPANPWQDYTAERLYVFLSSYSLTRMPGESFEYSNIGMGLLGHILSAYSGKSFQELVHDLIAKEMPNTSVPLTHEMSSNFASGYHEKQEVPHWDIALPGMGALHSNIEDMAYFLRANMGSDSLLTSPLQLCHQKQYSPNSEFSVGLGWMISHSDNSDIIWHNGETAGFCSFLGFEPKSQRGVVILSNSVIDDDSRWIDEFGFFLLSNHQN
jgi:CubicO group peptidase (beta-lactamase class C family)